MLNYLKAFKAAYKAHKGQRDKGGKPYLLHPLYVALGVKGRDEKITALLHDVIEDSNITIDELDFLTAKQKEALLLMTHDKKEPYFDYIKGIKSNPIARAVKISDLKQNSNLKRLKKVTAKDIERREKYLKALSMLR